MFRQDLETAALRDIDAVRALRAEWHALLAASGTAELFQTHEWLSAWWQVFGGGGRRPFVVTVRHRGRLVGVAPFLIRTIHRLGPMSVRRLELIGTGEAEPDEVCSDFLDILALPEHAQVISQRVWEHLAQEGHRWDEARFVNVLESSNLARFLGVEAQRRGGEAVIESRRQRFFVDLSVGDFDKYLATLSKKRRRRLAYDRRRLTRDGDFVEHRPRDRDEIAPFLNEVARLNRLRRSSRRKPSAFASARFRRFHELVAHALWEQGALELRLWRLRDRYVAAGYNFVYNGTVYHYQSGFDAAAFGNSSVGTLTLTDGIRGAMERGLRRFDFQIGAAGSYKEDYGCQTEPVVVMVLYNRTAAAKTIQLARRVRGAVKELARALPRRLAAWRAWRA